MRVSQYTAAICTLFVFGCAGHDLLPPAIPEPVSVFFIAAEDLEDFLPRGDDPRRPGLRLITPPPSMLETSASTLDYAAMRKAYRQQPRLRVAAQRTMPERETDAPAVQGVQFAAFPGQGGRAFDSMPTLPDVRGLEPRALPDYAPIRTTPLQRPQRQEKPEKVIADANAASLLSPTRQQYGRGGQVRYPYQEGSAYLVISSPDHPTVMTLPPGERLAVVPAMHPERWDLGYAEMGTDLARQEAIFIRPTAAGQEATTALVTKSGHIYYL